MTGIEIIEEERIRQMVVEGFTSNHDRQHENGELARAAASYALPSEVRDKMKCLWRKDVPSIFPNWRTECWKPSPEDRIKELAKAGALIAAEIDRLKNTIK